MSRSRRRPVFAATAILALAASALVRTQSPRPLGIVDMLSIPRITDPQLSPDGRDALFVRADADWKVGRRVTHVWRVPIAGGSPVQLTNGADGEESPRWSPDGRTVAFTAKRGDNEFAQIYLLATEGGEARQLTTHASAASNPTWAPDGRTIYFRAADAKSAEQKAREKARDDVYAYDENYQQVHLWTVNVSTGAETRITSGDFSVNSYQLSDDGKKIVYSLWPTPLHDLARRFAGALRLRLERAVRLVLQQPLVPRLDGRRSAAAHRRRARAARRGPRDLVEGRQVDLFPCEPGRPRGVVRRGSRRRDAEAADRRKAQRRRVDAARRSSRHAPERRGHRRRAVYDDRR